MEGMRRTSDGHKATDGLARLSVNARGVSLISSADSSPTGGAATAGGVGVPRGKAGSRATAAAGGGVVAASKVAQAQEDSEEVDERAVNAARSTAADAVAKAGREGAANVAATVRPSGCPGTHVRTRRRRLGFRAARLGSAPRCTRPRSTPGSRRRCGTARRWPPAATAARPHRPLPADRTEACGPRSPGAAAVRSGRG